MAIWDVTWNYYENYAPVALINDKEYAKKDLSFFSGKPIKELYIPLELKFLKGKHGDFAYLDPLAIVCTDKALEAIMSFVKDEVEILPASIKSRLCHILNVINIIDALDVEQSEFVTIKGGKIIDIKKYVFDETRLENQYLFKIPQTASGTIYATDAFKNLVSEAGLTGLAFDVPRSALAALGEIARSGGIPIGR